MNGRADGLAVVTGASSGLGIHFARALAAQGRELMLIARRQPEMLALAEELSGQHGITVSVRAADLSDRETLAAVGRELADRPVDLLINNAGFGIRGRFDLADASAIHGMVAVNMAALTLLSRAVLPGMAERRTGGVLNVASTAAFVPGPMMAVYYASKAYVLSLSDALWDEYRRFGVTVTALCPGPTRTEFADRAGMGRSPLFADKRLAAPETVVDCGLRALANGRRRAVPGWRYALFTRMAPWLPRSAVLPMVRRMNGGAGAM